MTSTAAGAAERHAAFTDPARVRYAPSPTGDPHVGNIRQAIWAWLYARHTGGQFIVRLEDTDQSRSVEGADQRIYDSLRWLGIDWDEGPDIGGPYAPYIQSERLPRYREAAARLLEDGAAYRCFCTPERLSEVRKEQQRAKQQPRYDLHCRYIDPAEAAGRAEAGEAHVLRFAVPLEGATTASDLLRGEITVDNDRLDDFVILKSDGFPTYHLASIVDDVAMEITHVTRGEEWLPSLPRHALLYEALGWEQPIWVHGPVILGPGGGKLSKRHGARSVLEYAAEGYVPEALLNYLCIIGWALDDHTEILSVQQLVEAFDLVDINASPATFDLEKLEWMNGVYLRDMTPERFTQLLSDRLLRELPPEVPRPLDAGLVDALTPLVQERVKLLTELTPLVGFFFAHEVSPPSAEEFLTRRWEDRAEDAANALAAVEEALNGLEPWASEALEAALRELATNLEVRAGDLFTLIRLAVTGQRISPPLFESMEIIGTGPCLDRIAAAIEVLRGA
jgi:glutamyl-tRNA synthetase